MYELPAKIKNLEPYAPLSGKYAIRLDANESFLKPPVWLHRKICDAVANMDLNRYPDPYCVKLRKAFGAYFGVDSSLVVAGNGSDELISLLINAFLSPGESMVTVSPDFSMYAFYAQMSGARTAVWNKDPDSLCIDIPALIAFAKENEAKMLMLSNPCNPTSLAASAADALKLVTELKDCLVVMDEAYMDFAEENASILGEAGKYPNLVILKTCSKSFGMAGIRLGFAVAPAAIAKALNAVKSPYNVNAMSQAAGSILLSEKAYLQECAQIIRKSRQTLYTGIKAMASKKKQVQKVYDTCTNFVFLRIEAAEEIFEALKKRGVAVRKIGDFLRISAGSPAENTAVIRELDRLLR